MKHMEMEWKCEKQSTYSRNAQKKKMEKPNNISHCEENGPLAHLLWILVFDDQQDQIGLTYLQLLVL
jgi:hypothetical protein